MKYFLCKFVSPRPDFLTSMTVEERKLLKEHGAYLQELLEQRIVVAHGPVADPDGVWGVSIFEINDSDDIDGLTAGDPMIRAGIGARYEVFPMLQMRARG